jgi:hypothetical protein
MVNFDLPVQTRTFVQIHVFSTNKVSFTEIELYTTTSNVKMKKFKGLCLKKTGRKLREE